MKRIFTLLIVLTAVCTNAQTVPEIEWEQSFGSGSNDSAAGVTATADGGYIVFGSVFELSGDVTTHYGSADYWIAKLDEQGTLEWERTYGGTDYDAAGGLIIETSRIQQTSDGGYILGGNSMSYDTDVSANFGGTDVWIVKIDSSGNIEWEQNYGSDADDNLSDIKETNEGGFIITYASSDYNTLIFNTTITKTDVQGAIEWSNSYGEGEFKFSNLYSIIQTADGGYITTGWTDADDSAITPEDEIVPGLYNISRLWVLKISDSGTFEWAKTYGGSNIDAGYSIVETADGNFVVAGMTYSGDGDAVGHPDPDNASSQWVLKLDSSGEILWQRTYGIVGNAVAVKIMPDGNYVIGGSFVQSIFTSNSGDTITSQGSTDEFLMKLDQATGDIIWTKTMGGTSNDNLWNFALTPGGGFITIGSSRSLDGDVTGNNGGFDYWVVKLGPDCVVPVVTAQSAYNVCSGSELMLSATSEGNTINWYSSKTITTILFTGNDFVVPAVTADASYWVEAVSPTGCTTERAEITVAVTALPELTVATTAYTICENTTVTLTAATAPGGTIAWYDSANATSPVASGTEFTTPALIGDTSYWVEATDAQTNCVSDRKEITITITQASLAVIGFVYSDDSVCIMGNSPALVPDNGFIWGGTFSAALGLSMDTSTGAVDLSASDPGTYTITYTLATSGCLLGGSHSATITITDRITPVVSFSYGKICTNDRSADPVLDNGFINSGTFSSTSGLSIDAVTGEINVAASQPGTYIVVYEVQENIVSCLESGRFELEVAINFCQIQRGISPNGDSMNDYFDLTDMGVSHLSIYNRYGAEIYTKSAYVKEWGGQDKDGKELPTGTYFYVIEKISGGRITGWIYINREHQ